MYSMHQLTAVVLTAGFLAACGQDRPSGAEQAQTAAVTTEPTATATLIDANGDTVGNATFVQANGQNDSATLRVEARSLAPGRHGIHIHERGMCTAPTFESAGDHLNPTGKEHGLENPAGPHAGDLPNLSVGADGTADTSFAIPGSLLAGANPLFAPDGAALVIHADEDDQRTDPAGKSGDRVACGVIERHRA